MRMKIRTSAKVSYKLSPYDHRIRDQDQNQDQDQDQGDISRVSNMANSYHNYHK